MDLHFFTEILLHTDKVLETIFQTYGIWTYAILFFIVFAETGLVIFPFLPGDSLLLAVGIVAGMGYVNVAFILVFLFLAAILGDTVNYFIGKYFGQKLVDNPRIPINQEHVNQTQEYYRKNGGKTIILARFIPIIRTFAPFVAGVSHMRYKDFMIFNVVGAFVWVFGLVLIGYFIGDKPFVKNNIEYAIFTIIFVSLLPVFFEFIKIKFKKHK